jgi:hypothetical protein
VEEEVSADSAVPKKGKVLQDLRVPKKEHYQKYGDISDTQKRFYQKVFGHIGHPKKELYLRMVVLIILMNWPGQYY